MERRSLKFQWLSNDRPPVSVTVLKQRWTEAGQCGIFPNKACIDGWSCDQRQLGAGQYFLKRTGVMVGMTVRNDNAEYHLGSYSFSFQRGGRIGWRIDHDAASVDPYNIPTCRSVLIKAVRISQYGDTKGRRMKHCFGWRNMGYGIRHLLDSRFTNRSTDG